MQKIAKFEKVSFDRFQKDWLKAFPETEDVQAVYDSIVLPQRATAGSAGYDFYVPAAVTFPKDASVLVPTGIRARMAEGWVLAIFPRSGLGFKHRIGLDNTVGIIDADYYGSSNEGHIMIKMSCTAHDAGHSATVAAGDGFAQGIFLPFGITEDDAADGVRDGGFGSTTNKSRTNGRVPTHAACIFAKEKGLRSSILKPFLSVSPGRWGWRCPFWTRGRIFPQSRD